MLDKLTAIEAKYSQIEARLAAPETVISCAANAGAAKRRHPKRLNAAFRAHRRKKRLSMFILLCCSTVAVHER